MAVPADPIAARSPVLFWFFGWYVRWMFWRRFDAVRISRAGLPRAAAGPLIIYCNHPSWWDPALHVLICTRLFRGRVGFGPMDAAALERYGVLKRMGVFGIELGTQRGARHFLRTSLRLLSDPNAILFVTAEGHFADSRVRPVRLQPGIAHLARLLPGATILPLALDYGFWNESRPEALIRFGDPIAASRETDVATWLARLERELTQTMDALAAESATRDPALFRAVQKGTAGEGGLYDLVRRVVALSRGEAFDPRHERGRP